MGLLKALFVCKILLVYNACFNMWWNQIINSFEYVRDSIVKFVYEQPFIFIIILILFILSSISRIFKLRLKKKYIEPYERSWNTDNKDFYVKYYQKIQYVDFFWAFIWILLIFVLGCVSMMNFDYVSDFFCIIIYIFSTNKKL